MRPALTFVALLASLLVTACDDDEAGDTERFCTGVAENVEALRAAPVTDEEVDDLIDLWRDLGADAPVAIETEWTTHADNLELAWTSDDQQEIMASTFAAERSTVAIAAWLEQNCHIDFGPVTTIVRSAGSTSTTRVATTTSTTTPG